MISIDKMQRGRFIESAPNIKRIAEAIQNKVESKEISVFKGISDYIKDLDSDESNKIELFRERKATEIIESGFQTGCTDRALVFLALAKELEIQALYVETFTKRSLGTDKAGMEGHVLVSVLDPEKGMRIYEPRIGFLDEYIYNGNELVIAGLGRDHSAVYLVNNDGSLKDDPVCLSRTSSLKEVALQINLPSGLNSKAWASSLGERKGFQKNL